MIKTLVDWNRLAWTDISLDVFDGYFNFILCHPTIIQYLRTEFGAPMNRPRFYLLLVRRDLMQADAKADFPSFVNGMLEKMKHYTEFDWILSSTWWVKKVHKYLTGLDWFNGMLKKYCLSYLGQIFSCLGTIGLCTNMLPKEKASRDWRPLWRKSFLSSMKFHECVQSSDNILPNQW